MKFYLLFNQNDGFQFIIGFWSMLIHSILNITPQKRNYEVESQEMCRSINIILQRNQKHEYWVKV